jgi:hypothetical protein
MSSKVPLGVFRGLLVKSGINKKNQTMMSSKVPPGGSRGLFKQ